MVTDSTTQAAPRKRFGKRTKIVAGALAFTTVGVGVAFAGYVNNAKTPGSVTASTMNPLVSAATVATQTDATCSVTAAGGIATLGMADAFGAGAACEFDLTLSLAGSNSPAYWTGTTLGDLPASLEYRVLDGVAGDSTIATCADNTLDPAYTKKVRVRLEAVSALPAGTTTWGQGVGVALSPQSQTTQAAATASCVAQSV